MTTIPKTLHYDQLPKTNLIELKEGDSISLITYKLPDGAKHDESDYIYSHERLGIVKWVNSDGAFMAEMESVSGKVKRDHVFTVTQLNRVCFAGMAHVLHKLN